MYHVDTPAPVRGAGMVDHTDVWSVKEKHSSEIRSHSSP